MSDANFTPGPWDWEFHPRMKTKLIALTAGKEDVILGTGDEEHSWMVVSDADMSLISAAPDLLEACEAMTASLEHDHDVPERYEADFVALKAAIKKAKGA